MSELLQAAPTPEAVVKPLDITKLVPALNVTLVTEENQLGLVQKYFDRVPLFGLDTETNMVDDFTQRRLRTIQVGDRNEQYVIDLLPFAQRAGQTLEVSQGPSFSSSLPYSPEGLPHDCYRPIVELLNPVFNSAKWLKVGHYLQFEYEVLLFCLGLRLWNLYDTILAEKLLQAGLHSPFERGYWGLSDLVVRYKERTISKELQTSFDLSTPLTASQVDYCALDVRLPLSIKTLQQKELEKDNLMRVAKIEFDAIPAFGDMFLNGITLDTDKWLGLVVKIEAQQQQNIAVLDEFFLPIVGSKHGDGLEEEIAALKVTFSSHPKGTPEARAAFEQLREKKKQRTKLKNLRSKCVGEALINYDSATQMLKALQKMGFDIADTNEKLTLKKLANKPEIAAVLAFRDCQKSLSTYGKEFLQHIHPLTRRIHSRIAQIGAATGRTSSRDPNLQNIKRASDYRRCFVAALGYLLITLDYNGAELRISTEYTREPAWLHAFQHGWDVHSVGAELVYGDEWKDAAEPDCKYYTLHEKCDCKKHKDLRTKVKSINFGIAYGIGPANLALELGITESEALDLLKRYRNAFPTLVKCLEAMGEAAAKNLYARTLSGRVRRFVSPSREAALESCQRRFGGVVTTNRLKSAYKGLYSAIGREGRNMAVQGTNADMVKLAMGCGADANNKKYLWHLMQTFGARLLLMVHDELVFEVPEGQAAEAFKVALDGMVRGGEEFVKCIPVTVDGNTSREWSK